MTGFPVFWCTGSLSSVSLIVRNAVIDNIVKIVIILDIHAIEIVSILVIRKLLNAAEGPDSGEIQSEKRNGG